MLLHNQISDSSSRMEAYFCFAECFYTVLRFIKLNLNYRKLLNRIPKRNACIIFQSNS